MFFVMWGMFSCFFFFFFFFLLLFLSFSFFLFFLFSFLFLFLSFFFLLWGRSESEESVIGGPRVQAICNSKCFFMESKLGD